MLILSRVCAEFHDRNGETVFAVTPRTRLTFQEAPAENESRPAASSRKSAAKP